MTEEPAHSRLFAPSAAHRWMNCTASSHAAAQYKDPAGVEAMEGTAGHWLMLDKCLVEGSNAKDYLFRTIDVQEGDIKRSFRVDREMAYCVQLGIDTVREFAHAPGAQTHVETKVNLTHIDPEFFGRNDIFGWVVNAGWVTLLDYKHGRRDVSPMRNPQLMSYAVGLYRMYFNEQPIQGFRFVIVQPRSLVPGPRVKEWSCELDELLNFELELRVAVREVRTAPTFKMGDWCKYCPALGACPESQEQRKYLSHALAMHDLGPVEAGKILALKPLLEKKIEDAKAVAKEALMLGQPVEGHKLVTGRKFRQWRDPDMARDEIVEAIGYSALPPPTPAAAEKLGKEAVDIVNRLSFTPAGEPEVAAADDKRQPYVARSAEQMFGAPS